MDSKGSSIFLWSQWSSLKLLVHGGMFYLRDLGLWLINVYKDDLEQAQGWTKSYE